jgi:hypothetical protein
VALGFAVEAAAVTATGVVVGAGTVLTKGKGTGGVGSVSDCFS